MEQTSEHFHKPDVGRLMSNAMDLTQPALASHTGKAVPAAILNGQDGLMRQLSQAAQKRALDPITQARVMLTEQRQHFDTMRIAIHQMGHSLEHLNASAPGGHSPQPHTTALLNAQSEAIQGLTLLALKGQQMQAELINAIDAQSHRVTAPGTPKWIYSLIGFMVLLNMLGMIFFGMIF